MYICTEIKTKEMIPTAEEFINVFDRESGFELSPHERKVYSKRMIEFAKMHVTEALEAAAYAASETDNPEYVLTAYPLTNIK